MNAKRVAVLAAARGWLRTPYHHMAAVPGVGIDCAMILVRVFGDPSVGLIPADFDPRPYPKDWMLHRTEERYLGWLKDFADRVEEAMPGDVAIWQFGRTFSHAAIVLEDAKQIIHAYFGAGCVVYGRLDETTLADRQRQLWRVRGIEGAA